MSALFAIAMGCFILGVLVDLIFGVASKYARPWPYVLALSGSTCLVLICVTSSTSGALSTDPHC